MQQPCSRCGYISDRPARFCRQCGSQLFNETESSSAATRNYAPQQVRSQYSDPVGINSPYSPGPRLDEQIPDTTPFYRPPIVPQSQVPEQRPTNWGKWVLIGLLSMLLLTVLAAGGIFYVSKQWFQHEAKSTQNDSVKEFPPLPVPPEVPAAPGAPPPPPAPGNPTSGNLDNYKYPDATVLESHRDGINEVIKMTTDDDLETVKDYYDGKFKNSSISIKNEEGQKFVFTTLGHPLITIIVQPDEAHEGKTEINLLRANISIPKIAIPRL